MYGWRKYGKEGIKELKRILNSSVLANKPSQKKYIRRYIELYEKYTNSINEIEEFDINHKDFIDLLPKRSGNPEQTIYGNISNLKKSIDEFYQEEDGKKSEFRIYFVTKGSYLLGIKKIEIIEEGDKPKKSAYYKEKTHFKIKISKSGLFLLTITFILVACVSLILEVILIIKKSYGLWLIPCTLLTSSLIYIGFFRLIPINEERRFIHLVSKLFIKYDITNSILIIASYSADCPFPGCDGKVELTRNKILDDKNYVGICDRKPELHVFTFNYDSLKGLEIS